MNYRGKVVLVTGSSSTIGKEIINFFASLGAKLIITYYHSKESVNRDKEKLEKKYQTSIDFFYLDLCQEKSIVDLYNYVKNKYKKIDILINNAALSIDCHIIDKTKDEFVKVMEVNVIGTFLMMKYFDKLISHGFIFNMSSTDGIDTGNIYSIDYNASKAAINNMTKTFAL